MSNLDIIYNPSEKIVAREIEGEFIIVPLVAGIGDMDDEIFSLNETGKAIWSKLDGQNSLKAVIDSLSNEFDVPKKEIQQDVVGLINELVKRQMLEIVNNN